MKKTEHIKNLCEALKENKTLTNLDLEGNYLGSKLDNIEEIC